MGLMFPATFIPLAEETGLITQIGDWVLQTACVDAATWPATTKVTVNLSPVQVRNSDLLATVTRALSGSGLQAERLELEITEAALIDNEVHCATLLRQFKGLGVTIALDEFSNRPDQDRQIVHQKLHQERRLRGDHIRDHEAGI